MIVGVDVGGTFTDAALLTGDRLVVGKSPTTPADQSEGVMSAVSEALEAAEASAADVERFVHGMTVGTNALLEGRVARTALLATEGFTDLEELGRQARAGLYGLDAEAAAVCLLWGFRHPEHEERAAELLEEAVPGIHVSTSHETAGVFREYERWATTVVDAALS